MPDPGEMDRRVLEHELDTAWAVMKHHEAVAARRDRELNIQRRALARERPLSFEFRNIQNYMAQYRTKLLSAEATLEKIQASIDYGEKRFAEVESAQAKIKAAASL